jgi:hypothetical protein
MSKGSPFRLPLASFLTSCFQLREVGQSGRIRNSSTTTRSIEAGTLRPGNSRSSFQKKFAPASGHYANPEQRRFARSPQILVCGLLIGSSPPTARGGSILDAFHVVIPSMPGYGFSAKPNTAGWDPARIARAWVVHWARRRYLGAKEGRNRPKLSSRSLRTPYSRVGMFARRALACGWPSATKNISLLETISLAVGTPTRLT